MRIRSSRIWLFLLVLLLAAAAVTIMTRPPEPVVARNVRPQPQAVTLGTLTQEELFDPERMWTAQLTLTTDQWNRMQPTFGGAARSSGDDWLQSAKGGRNGWGTVLGVEFAYVHVDLEFEGTRLPDVAVRFKGNGTFTNSGGKPAKNSLKIDLNKFVKGQTIAGVSTLNFHNNVTDEGLLNETVAFRLFREAEVPAPRTSWVRVFLSVQGRYDRQYLGLYSLVENVDTHFLNSRSADKAGAILKPSTRNPFLDRGDSWSAAYQQTYDPKTDLTSAEQRRVIEFSQFVSTASDSDFEARIGQFIDIDEFARYFAVVLWLADLDGMLERGQNYYVHMPPGNGPFAFIPWDQDRTFGTWAKIEPGRYDTLSIDPPWGSSVRVRFLERMNGVPAFRNAYRSRLHEFTQTILTADSIAPFMTTVARVIRPAVVDEPSRLARFDRSAAGQEGILPFAKLRTASVAEQLAR
ncbi:MAG: CotH kinase family protein [Vicinamibacterales bacterium]